MADESGGRGGGKYRGRKKRKSGVRKSNITLPKSGLGGIAGIGGSSTPASPSIGNWINSMFQDAANNLSGTSDPASGGLQGLLGDASSRFSKSPSGGYNMQKVEPPITMRPKPSKVIDDNAAYSNDGYSATQQFMDLATSLLTQPGASYDYESAQREAAGAIRQAYGAEIAAIRQNNRVARKSSRRARKEITHLYKGLAKMYGKQENRAVRRGEKAADAQMDIANQGNTILTDLNNQMIQDESQLLKDLGQEQAFSQLISPDFDRMGQQVADNTKMGTDAASRAIRMGENNARWFDRAQGGARLEGTNRRADMIGQLQAYLMNNRNQIAGLKGDRAQEIAASNMNIESQAAQAANDANQQTFDNVLKLLGVSADIEDTNIDNQRQAAEFRWDKKMDRKNLRLKMRDAAETGNTDSLEHYSPGIRDAMSIIAQTPDKSDQKATDALWKLFASNAWRGGEVALPGNAGQTANLTPYEAAARARKVGVRMGLKGRELQEFVNAAAASVR
jgi:hypothetical protein